MVVAQQHPRRTKAFAGEAELDYRTVVVPLDDDPESLGAVPTACKLAAEDSGAIVGVFVIEIPSELPLQAHMFDAERNAREALGRARAAAEAFGLRFSGRIVRAHGAAEAIVAEAERLGADLIVLAARREPNRRPRAPLFDKTVRTVLVEAPCRVAVVALPQQEREARVER
jgi:nucleotide-binding universal stress UspA family protein